MTTVPRWLAAMFVVVLLALAAGGACFFRAQEHQLRTDVEANLSSVARLKVDQITRWRAERLGDAAVLMEDPFIAEALGRCVASPRDPAAEQILGRFRSLQKNYHYSDVLLLDSRGQVRLSLSGRTAPIQEDTLASIEIAFRERRPVLTDLHAGHGGLPPRISAVAPFHAGNGETAEPMGAILLQSDARQYLYPLIQSWPTPSHSAETLLVRRDGDAALFLNDPRRRPDTAFKLRIPSTNEESPAVMAILGKEGAVEGRDFRGVEVLAVLKAIPDTPWLMVAQIDKEEALAAWRFRSVLILALMLGFVAAAGTAGGMVWQHYAKARYRALFQAEAALRESEELSHRTTLMSIGDAVIVTDARGRVRLLNPVAEALTGWGRDEAGGRPVSEVFRILNEETRRTVEDPVARVLREGVVIGLANHTLLISRDGGEFPVADSGAPIRDEAGTITGVVLVFRDQTSERNAEAGLQAAVSRQQALLAAVPDIIMEVDADKVYTWGNPAGLDFFGEDAIGKEASYYFEGEQDTYGVTKPLFNGDETVIYVESWQRRKDGRKRLLAWWCRVLKDRSGKVTGALSSARDITEQKQAGQELEKALHRVVSILESISDSFVAFDPEWRFSYVNTQAERTLGVRREDLLGRSNWKVFPFTVGGEIERLYRGVMETRVAAELEYYHALEDRWLRKWISLKAYPAEDGGISVFFRDITERKRTEDLVRARLNLLEFAVSHSLEELLRETLDEVGALTDSPIGFYHFVESDQQTLSLQAWSTRTLEEFCRAEGEGLHYPISRAGVWTDCVRERRPVVHNDYSALPHRKGLPEGHAAVIRELVVPIMRSDRVVAILGVGNKSTDYTREDVELVSYLADVAWEIAVRKRMEKERRQSEESYRLLVRNIPAVVYRGYADGGVEFFDDKIQAVTGYPMEDFASRKLKWTDIIHPKDLVPAKRAFHEALRGERGYVREYRVRRRDGQYAWVQERSQIVCHENGSIDYISGVLFDVTANKRSEEEKEKLDAQFRQAQKMEAVGRLAGGVAHDFNNMLGVILGYTELALAVLKPIDPIYRDLKVVREAANRSAELTRQLLAFSRKQTIAPRSVDLNHQTKGMERLLARIIGEDIDLMFKLSEGLWPVYMDPAQIDQVLANLAVNSRDAMPEGGKLTVETANITLDAEYCEKNAGFTPGDFVMLAVSDTGCGMEKETLEHVFEPFFTTKPEGKGTGLGLATIYGIVKQNNGFVNIYSEPGQGTTVRVYIPRYVGRETALPVAVDEGRPAGLGETVLLVEDEAKMLELVKAMLERLGYRVLDAAGPGEAIALCEKYPGEIHLLLTDVVMPNMSGKELAGRILTMKPDAGTLFMSGYTANAIAHRGVLEKGALFLQKPFSLDVLARKVREALAARS